ncbi:hypothetical protein NT6N_11150 [Oceaniferula spumae]|uniref:Ice-binding protein C-terminal domain-containing protein n=1 Tax=Oceaniferula spumae TaxID=2979115 RepID=A0AAT9FJG0_9BACT
MKFPIFSSLLLASCTLPISAATLISQFDFSAANPFQNQLGPGNNPLSQLIDQGTSTTVNQSGGYVSMNGTSYLQGAASGGGDSSSLSGGTATQNGKWGYSVWFRTSDVGQADFTGLVSHGSADFSHQVSFGPTSGQLLSLMQGGDTQGQDSVAIIDGLQADTWYHLIMTRDASDNNQATVGITPFGQATANTPLDTTPTATNIGHGGDFRLGSNRAESLFFEGDFANLQVFTGELSQSEIQTLYENPNFDAIPEPSSAALLGLAGLGFILRRRK